MGATFNTYHTIISFKTLEACMKNCGGPIHDEVATRDCMDELRNLANVSIKLFAIQNLLVYSPLSHYIFPGISAHPLRTHRPWS